MEEKEKYKSVRLRESYWKEISHLAIELDKSIGETVKYLFDQHRKYSGVGIKKTPYK